MAATVQSPTKVFNWRVELSWPVNLLVSAPNDLTYYVQEFKLPSQSHDIDEHGDAQRVIKTAGLKRIGEITISYIQNTELTGITLAQALLSLMNLIQGRPPSDYKFRLTFTELQHDEATPHRIFVLEGCWISQTEYIQMTKTDSGNVMDSLTLQCDNIYSVSVGGLDTILS